jgi:hypothetical protein
VPARIERGDETREQLGRIRASRRERGGETGERMRMVRSDSLELRARVVVDDLDVLGAVDEADLARSETAQLRRR